MKKIDNGGAAFARSSCTYSSAQDGMSLRDWLGGMALEELRQDAFGYALTSKEVAKRAYEDADAMLKERAKEHEKD